jgi:hypothetical protein
MLCLGPVFTLRSQRGFQSRPVSLGKALRAPNKTWIFLLSEPISNHYLGLKSDDPMIGKESVEIIRK